ncbi:cytochrome P450 [Xylariomycetidae sp. FL2044]|nr:cytochrome P450 [Xylariomycetidae sp. FL2044]
MSVKEVLRSNLGAVGPIAGGLLILVVYFVAQTALTWYRLRHFKGPRLAAFSHLWAVGTVMTERPDIRYAETQEKYGTPLIRVAPDTLLTDDPEVVRRINSVRNGYGRSTWYHGFRVNPSQHNMISTTDDGLHDLIKSRTSGGYSFREVPSIEEDVNGTISAFIDLIRQNYLSTSTVANHVDWAQIAQYFTLDTLSKVAFGKEFGCMSANQDVHDFMETSKKGMGFMTLCAEVPLLRSILTSRIFLRFAGPKNTDAKGIGSLMRIAEQAVGERWGPNNKSVPDMLGSFVRSGLSREQCEAESLLQIIAGSDSTAIVIRCTMLFLSTTPHAYRRLQEEIDCGIAEGKISSPITNAEAKQLPYLQAVISETRRYHPTNVATFPKVVPRNGDTLAGQYVPGGTKIGINQRRLMRNKDIFGPDPEVFKPERWIDASAERRDQMARVVDLLFGHGRYMCAGRGLALMELNKVFVELLRRYDFQLVNITKPWTEEIHTNIFVSNEWMRITERQR